jgi:large subunit ribosomal protein L2
MALIKSKPTSPGRRFQVKISRDHLHKGGPVESLVVHKNSTGARNSSVVRPCATRAAAHKQKYRLVDFLRNKDGVPGKVERLEYDPNRTAHLALVLYADGERRYIIAPKGVAAAMRCFPVRKRRSSRAIRCSCVTFPIGTTIHCVELKPGKGAQLARSAGASAQLAAREGMYATVRLRSNETRKVQIDCRATIGEVGNDEHSLRQYGKAGAIRWRGIRPTVRGVVMNPVDHPHGGGEGKSGQGNPHPVSPWGWNTKGKKNPQEQAHGQHDRASPELREERKQCLVQSKRARSSICTSRRKFARPQRRTTVAPSRPGRAVP